MERLLSKDITLTKVKYVEEKGPKGTALRVSEKTWTFHLASIFWRRASKSSISFGEYIGSFQSCRL